MKVNKNNEVNLEEVAEEVVYRGVKFKLVEHPDVESGVYYVSKDGRVYSTKSKKVLKPQHHKNDYQHLQLKYDKEKGRYTKKMYIHHIVAYTYLGERPEVYLGDGRKVELVLDHKDDNKYNNRLDNLEYITQAENVQKGKRSKLSASKVRKLREASKKGDIDLELIGKELGVSKRTIEDVLSNRTWKNVKVV